MAYEGILINAAVTLLAGACYLFVATEVYRKRVRQGSRSRPALAFFLLVGVFLLLAGLRQAAAYVGTVDPSLAWLDRTLYWVVVVPAAAPIVPLAYLTARAAWGSERRARLVASFFAGVLVLGVSLIYAGGITGPEITYWGSDWSINSVAAQVMIVLFLTLPALAASGLLMYTGSQMAPGPGRRLRLVGWSCLIYYVAFTLDAFGLEGWAFIAARIATAGAAFLGYVAYVRTSADDAEPSAGVAA